MKDQGFNSCELIWQELLSALSTQKKVDCHYVFVSAKTKTNDQWWFWELYENGRHTEGQNLQWEELISCHDFMFLKYGFKISSLLFTPQAILEKFVNNTNDCLYVWVWIIQSKDWFKTLIHSAMKKVSESLNHSLNRLILKFIQERNTLTRVALRCAMLLLWLCLGLLHWLQ